MIRLAFKNLLHEPSRLLVSLGGVAAALFMILLLNGIFEGTSKQLVTYLEKSDADVWVMQEGVSNMHMATSILPAQWEKAISSVQGVMAVTPILYAANPIQIKEQRWLSYIVGVRPGSQRGGPWEMQEGSANPGSGEAVISDVMARKGGIKVGDSVEILGRRFKVVGLSRGTFSMANSVTFISYGDMEDILSAPGAASYFLVRAQPGVSASLLAERIRQGVPGVNAMTREAFVSSDRTLSEQMGVEIIQVMSLIGFTVGVLVIGLTIYTATMRRAREYGIVKALGAKNRYLIGIVVLQTLTIALLGLALAVGVAYLVRPLLEVLVPEVPLLYLVGTVVRVSVISVGIAIVAALLPAYRIARVEPAMVFKE